MSPHHSSLPLWIDRSPEEKLEALHELVLDLYGYIMQAAIKEILHTLAMHPSEDQAESQSVALMQQLIAAHPNILAQNSEVGHITGSALIVEERQGRVLLMHHLKLDRWLQMGGHGEFEFSPSQIAMREAKEESGLADLEFLPRVSPPVPVDIDAHIIPAQKGRPEHYHLDFRYVLVTKRPEDIARHEAEAKDLRWFSFDDIERLGLQAPTLRLVKKALRLVNRT